MRIPVIRGIIDRRILVNYRIHADVMASVLPPPFRPQLAHGYAIGGICLIRLKQIRPRFVPGPCGLGSENAAHRFAVEWELDGVTQSGVYIPRRDTNSRLNTLAGGSIFPGVHHHARFDVAESNGNYSVALESDDHVIRLTVSGRITDALPASSIFASVDEASEFFAKGSLGYSATRSPGKFDGLELRCDTWQVEPLEIDRVSSSHFEDQARFPKGSVEFDCALLMRGIAHEWRGRESLSYAGEATATAISPVLARVIP